MDLLSDVLIEHIVHAHALEIGKGLLCAKFFSFGRMWEADVSLPVRLAEHVLPESSELLACVPGPAVTPVEVSCVDVERVFDRVLLEVLLDQVLGTWLAPECCPPVLELTANDGDLSELTAFVHVMRAQFHGEFEVLLPALLLIVRKLLDGLVPGEGQLMVIDHALLQLVAHIQIEGGQDEASIEVSNFVSIAF